MTALVLIAAMAENRVIGRDGDLPWRLPEDLKRFKRLTLGKTILMGRKTWVSLGRPLPERQNWVLTRDAAFRPDGASVFADLPAALAAHGDGELTIIGGADLYRQTLPMATRLELTLVHGNVDGDARFPAFDPAEWTETFRERHPADERHALPYSFVTLVRKPAAAAL